MPATLEATYADGTNAGPAAGPRTSSSGTCSPVELCGKGTRRLAAQRRSPGRDEPSPDRRGAARTLRVDAVAVA
ncbi:hypothetical protein [Streptomyces camelliae]|uniref:Uncharacterized protein n=1 Tax=Streptomyces camelliae TaxID=3004093 RepID=A0ABY7PKA9_9ACTN|nr:hypothetical protein [Streptomyces sp. HUAS 2-6]WBO69273.1 hypothetical protein O1G22_20030 [Streptomyces sp. HUAS 2-6]